MKSFVTLSLAASAYAQCCTFNLTASGGQSGTVGQLPDGQVRIGGGLPQSNFTICNGTVTDAAGFGCVLTPETNQFQCDLNKSPQSGFSIANNGTFEFSGSSVFYACPASNAEWNVYTVPVPGQTKCVEISLAASGCGAKTCPTAPISTVTYTETVSYISTVIQVSTATVTVCPATSIQVPPPVSVPGSTTTVVVTPPVSVSTSPIATTPTTAPTSYVTPPVTTIYPPTSTYTPTSSVPLSTAPTTFLTSTKSYHWSNSTRTVPTSTAPAPTCVATTLTGSSTAGNYQFPHLIVPVSSSSPNTAYGTQYFGTISPTVSSIFNFDIPASYAGRTCNLVFLLPLKSQLETSSYTFSGNGAVDFELLSSPATTGTTYANAPSVSADLGSFTLTEGSSTLISSFACPAGQRVAYEAKAVGNTDLYFFQDYNPSPLGLYVTVC